jgi:hypothetical protein
MSHIRIDRCDVPRNSWRHSYVLGDLWRCDCGQMWRWATWHDFISNAGCTTRIGWRHDVTTNLNDPQCKHFKEEK